MRVSKEISSSAVVLIFGSLFSLYCVTHREVLFFSFIFTHYHTFGFLSNTDLSGSSPLSQVSPSQQHWTLVLTHLLILTCHFAFLLTFTALQDIF